jgi:hypothetical protein
MNLKMRSLIIRHLRILRFMGATRATSFRGGLIMSLSGMVGRRGSTTACSLPPYEELNQAIAELLSRASKSLIPNKRHAPGRASNWDENSPFSASWRLYVRPVMLNHFIHSGQLIQRAGVHFGMRLEETYGCGLMLIVLPGECHQQVRVGQDHGKSFDDLLTSAVPSGSPTNTRRPFRHSSLGRALSAALSRLEFLLPSQFNAGGPVPPDVVADTG